MRRIDSSMWIGLLDETIPLLLCTALGITLYRGFRKNQDLLTEREDLLKRYLIFRGNKQMRLKRLGPEEKAYQELLKAISNSWKNFKRSYDQYLVAFDQNTARTKLFLKVITLGLLFNSARFLISDYLFSNAPIRFLFTVVRELSSYVLVVLSFFLLRTQTQRFLRSKWKVAETDRDLFFPNSLSEEERAGLYDEFDPLEVRGVENGKEDPDLHRGVEG